MKNAKIFNVLLLSATFLSALVGCGQTAGSSQNPNTSNTSSETSSEATKQDYTVTFYYGLDHSQTLVKTSYNGAKVGLTNKQIASFAVTGYRVSGYSTDAWKYDGITSDLDVYVQYTELDKYKVTFKNPDGSVISQVEVREGESVKEEDIPTAREVTTSTGYYFSGWDNDSLTENVTENVDITATQKQADIIIPKVTTTIALDGTRDSGYVKLGDLSRLVNGKTTSNWTTDAKGIDASIYSCWNGDYIYYFVEVTDPTVVSFGKSYYENFDNHWLGDKVELWTAINDTYEMSSFDALGYTARHHTLSNYIQTNKLFAAKLIGDELSNYSNGTPVVTNATGYNIEIALPAYTPVSTDISECEKLISKDFLHTSLQINSADVVNEQLIQDSITNGTDISRDAIGQIWTGKQIGDKKALADEDNVWSIILG